MSPVGVTATTVGQSETAERALHSRRFTILLRTLRQLPRVLARREEALSTECPMTAFNVVRFQIKPGEEARFLDAHRSGRANWPGLQRGAIIRTGERSYCLIGEWADPDSLRAARTAMIATLDGFRELLEDLGEGRGVTDAISGPEVLRLPD